MNRVGWVPVKPGPKQKEREHMRAEKEGGGWVPVMPGLKQYKQGTRDAINGWIRSNDSNCWLSGHRNHPRTCIPERQGWVPVKPGPKNQRENTWEQIRIDWGGSQLSRDWNKKKESTWEQRKKGMGESQLSQHSNITNKGHMRWNKRMNSMQR